MKAHILENFLSKEEKDALAVFWQNELMREAVRKVLFAGSRYNGIFIEDMPLDPKKNIAFALASQARMNPLINYEMLGRDIATQFEALCVIENAFDKISEFQIQKENKPKSNEAR